MNESKNALFGLVLLSASIICMSSFTKTRTIAFRYTIHILLYLIIIVIIIIIIITIIIIIMIVIIRLLNKEYNDILNLLFSQQPNVTSATRHALSNSSKVNIIINATTITTTIITINITTTRRLQRMKSFN